MMRPRRVAGGADHELVVGLLGAVAALDEVSALIAWIAEDASPRAAQVCEPELVDVLLGIAALAARVDHGRPTPTEGGAKRFERLDPAVAVPATAEDLLR